MFNTLFRLEACEADAAIDPLTFLPENPRTPQFRFKHTAVSTVQDSFPSTFRFYSSYVFLHIFTGLQVILGIFTLYIFNYFGTVRYYYAPKFIIVLNDKNLSSSYLHEWGKQLQLVKNPREALACVYLAISSLGIFFVIFVALYVIVTNSDWWISLELKRWTSDQESNLQSEVMRDAMITFESRDSTFSELNRRHHHNHYYYDHNQQQNEMQDCSNESNGSRLRRLGVRWVSCTRPYYVFPSRYLSDFDYRHDLHVRYGSSAARRDPKRTIFYLSTPFVLLLLILDIITVDDMRRLGLQVTLLQGLLLACGPLFLLYVLQDILRRGLTSGKTFLGDIMNILSS
ncbi:hypothetical protein LSM04_001733 [Trypanosoma melophagium]|uniref:uncharacterized protein n=1 Tax=Trypanosoma melophagium TaxID=715481 RepID=UPI003519DC3D|nr:hypothetical protein LSM04_001733 [Trypanosoma melophagium]